MKKKERFLSKNLQKAPKCGHIYRKIGLQMVWLRNGIMENIKKSVDVIVVIVVIDVFGAKYHKTSIASIASRKNTLSIVVGLNPT